MLNGDSGIRAGAKSHQGKIHTKVPSARGAENFMQARQGRVALAEGFMVTGVPVSCRKIHAAARLAREGSWLGSAEESRKQREAESSRRQATLMEGSQNWRGS